MLQPRRFGSAGIAAATCLLFICLLENAVLGYGDDWRGDPGGGDHLEDVKVDRVKRDNSGVTTLLLVNNDEARHIRGSRPEGLLTSTARTFVHDGTTTEYGTQIIGTSLDHGRFYAQLLQTSSRVYFGDQERAQVPKAKPDERVTHKSRYFPLNPLNLENYINPTVFYDVRPAETILVYPTKADESLNLVKPETSSVSSPPSVSSPSKSENGVEILVKENTGNIYYNEKVKEKERQAVEEVMRMQKALGGGLIINQTRAFANDLPTYTVRHDFAPSGFSWTIPENEKEEVSVKVEKKFRSGKGLHGKAAEKKLDTVTYLGFADFTTTVGDTVIVFMPNTRDGSSKPTQTAEPEPTRSKSEEPKVMTTVKTFFSHSPGMVTRTIPGHNLSMQTSIPTQVAERQSKGMSDGIDVVSSFLSKEQDNFENPSSTNIEPSETSHLPISKSSHVPTDPLATFATTITKTFGTGGSDKPLGLLKSIGGTKAYNGTTTHFTSLLYGTYVGDSYTQILKTSSSVFYLPETSKNIAATKVLSRPETTTPELDAITTEEPEDQLTTLTDEGKTTMEMESTTPEPSDEDDEEEDTADLVTPTEEYITRIVPSTVYKTFTYLTTFFIPAADGTTTSIRSREVISSELSYVTKVVETDLKHTEIIENEIKPTEFNFIDSDVDPEFLPPATRVLAPEEPITTTEETETEEDTDSTTTESSTEQTTEASDKEEDLGTSRKAPPSSTESEKSYETKEDKSTAEEEEEEDDEEKEEEKSEEGKVVKDHKNEEEVKKKEDAKKEAAPSNEDDEEEIEVIFKTIYTTYTYLTTFFQESTTSISSREVVVSNVITSTLESTTTPTARDLAIEPTTTVSEAEIKPTAAVEEAVPARDEESVEPSTVLEGVEETTTETPELKINGVKTFFTTFTYFTTLFDKGATNVISRTEVVTNVVNPTVSALPASILQNEELLKSKFEMLLREQQSLRSQNASPSSSSSSVIISSPSSTEPTTFYRSSLAPSSARGKYGTLVRKSKILSPGSSLVLSSANELDNSVGRFRLKGDKYDRTVVRKRIRTKSRLLPKPTTIEEGVTTIRLDPTPIEEDDRVILQTMITDVTKTTSGGNRQVKRIAPPEPVEAPVLQLEDQISSESNTEEIEPSPTLLLQTSFTTFTYFTTVYKGTTSDVISRLETITNVVTETLKPDVIVTPALSPEDATLPITYFTTFTYWTTLYRDGSTVITSREETVSNIVTPTVEATIADILTKPQIETTIPVVQPAIQATESSSEPPAVQTVFVPAFVPAAVPVTTTEEEPVTPITAKPIDEVTEGLINKAGIDEEEKAEPTTFYTTYTYFTTSYIGDSTVVKSRLETITNIITATPTISEITANDLQTGRAVNSASANQIPEDSKGSETAGSDLQTGLLSTIVSTSVNDGVTTLYSTDIFGTFIDGLYAKVLESTTKIATEVDIMPSKSMSEQKTGIVSINEGRIVDADGISTTFFTTKAIGTSIEQLYAQVVESTSSVVIDQDKKSALAILNGGEENSDIFRTGLVRLIEGSIVQDGTVTLYESRVIGTVIDGRYAQIIESTSSFKIEPSIAPSIVIKTDVTPTIQPSSSPPTIESSIADDVKEEEEEEEGDEEEEDYDDKDKGRVKSRLTFQSRKRTFTPVIRPFASRNRPTFLPKKKTIGASSAQTITRAFTPTVTATLATKADGNLGSSRNRFGSGRRSSTNQPEVRPTVTTSGRRFSGRGRTSVSSPVVSSTYSPSRGRQSSVRVTATPTLNLSSSRSRAFRVSSSRPVLGSERTNLSLRPRIRPTLSGFPGSRSTAANPPNQDEANDLTTVVTEEDLGVTLEDESAITTTTTTTEDPNLARRNNNPLLRFRRPPLIPKVTTSTTPRTTTTQAPRRGILSGRNNRPTGSTFTTPRAPRTRPSNSFANRSQLPNRPRPVNSLFPPRGLLKKPTQQEEEKEEDEVEDEELETEEDEDNNFEESSAKEVEAEAEEKVAEAPRGRSLPPVQIRPFRFQRTRTKRQTYEYGARNRQYTESKYRRKSRPQIQDRSDYIDEEPTEAPRVTSRTGRTYTSRTRGTTQAPNVASPPRIRPTLASSQKPQFTLREKETTNPRTSNFRSRTQTTPRRKSSIQKPTESTLTRKPTRARTSTTNQEYSRTQQRRNYNNRRTSSASRGRGRFGDIEDTYTYQQPIFDGTITVTHKIPSEASIPFVNGKVTEYRNVITASPSLEIVGPHQYTISSINGGSVIFLNREVTETLSNGLTEVTRFLIHETPTTSITFTPTTIRGRKTSFSHIVPSTVYDVENVVTTLQPQISANAPLANILLSQLLLGNLNLPPNQPIGLNQPSTPATPSTEYKTRTTTYVTSVTDHTSTVLPITFRGKEILTTIVDSSVNVITATEYITDTIVVTPTLTSNNQINSLLLPALLQAQLLQPTTPQIQTVPNQFPFPDGINLEALQQEEPKIAKNDIRGERESEEITEEEKPEVRVKSRKKSEKKQQQLQPEPAKEVITLYVSGRRPGEFSTILSTVYSSDTPAAVRKRETVLDDIERLLLEASEVKQVRVLASELPEASRETSYLDYFATPGVAAPVESNEFNVETQSLESVLGDVSKLEIRSPSSRDSVEPTRTASEAKVTRKKFLVLWVSFWRKTTNESRLQTTSALNTCPLTSWFFFLLGIGIKRYDEDGRGLGVVEPRYNLATKVMSNGVEVIVATDRNIRPPETEFLRLLSSTVTRPITLAPHTLINHMSMVLASEKEDENDLFASLHDNFITRTHYTTYTYLSTVVQNGETGISTVKATVTNVKTEEESSRNNVIKPTTTREITLTESPSLQTEIFHTTYTYLNTIVDGDQPLVMTSRYAVSNTVTAHHDYFTQLEPSEVYPTTNTYLKTVEFTKTLTDGTDSQIVSTKNEVTQVVITEAFDRETVIKPMTTDVTKTYFVTYTYFSTYIDGDTTKVKSDVSVSSDVTIEKFYIKPKKTTTKYAEMTSVTRTAPMNIVATKTYLTTFTYFTTLLHGPSGEKPETIVTTRTRVMQNVVTETLSHKHFNEDYLIDLQNSLESQGSGNLVTTATLKGGEQMEITVFKGGTTGMAHTMSGEANVQLNNIQPEKRTTAHDGSTVNVKATQTKLNDVTAEALVAEENEVIETASRPSTATTVKYTNHNVNQTEVVHITPTKTSTVASTVKRQDVVEEEEESVEGDQSVKKKPQKQTTDHPVNFLNLTSLGINGINVLGPVFNAMAELINNNIKSKANESIPVKKVQTVKKPVSNNANPLLNFVSGLKQTGEAKHKSTTPRTPVYIPVGSFAEDHEVSESQSKVVVAQNWLDTQGKNLEKNRIENGIAILEGGIPISPGQIITTNSDVIIGRPGSSGPRPPNFAVKNNVPIDMKPPPPPLTLEIPLDDVVGQHSTIKNVKPGEHAHRQKHKPHDSGAHDLNPPPAPPILNVHRPITINHKPHEIIPYKPENVEANIIPIPVHLMENYANGNIRHHVAGVGTVPGGQVNIIGKPTPSGHVATHNDQLQINSNMEDRSTGHPLLVNIQPSQVANVVIPPGSSTALIINNENQHSLKGEVIDDPSPHPEPETVGFVGAEPVLRLENGDLTPPLKNVHKRPIPEPNRPFRQSPANKVMHGGHHYHFPQNAVGESGASRVEHQNMRPPIYNQGHHYRDVITNGFGEHKHPVKVGGGIYVDVSPPGHLPPRPDFIQGHGSVHPLKAPGAITDNFSTHQSGLVHDVPLNAQVQLGSASNKEQSVKDILINVNKFDKIKQKHPGQNKNQNSAKKQQENITENLHPPPPPPDGVKNGNRRPPWHHPPYHPPQSPTSFIVPPPQVSHRPNYKPGAEAHPTGPMMIPVGAGAPDQIYPYPRPEDIVIIPPNIYAQQSSHFDLDTGDANDPVRTEDGEEIQESNSRPLLPGQLPAELERINKTVDENRVNLHYNAEINYGVGRPYVVPVRPQVPYYYHNKSSDAIRVNYGVHYNGGIYNEAEQIFGSKLSGNTIRVPRPPATQETSSSNKVRVEATVDKVSAHDRVNITWTDKHKTDDRKTPRPQQSTKRPPKPFSTSTLQHDNLWISHGSSQTTKRPLDVSTQSWVKVSEEKKPTRVTIGTRNTTVAENKLEDNHKYWNHQNEQKQRPRRPQNTTIDINRSKPNLTNHRTSNVSSQQLPQIEHGIRNKTSPQPTVIRHPGWVENVPANEITRVPQQSNKKHADTGLQQTSASENIWTHHAVQPVTEKVRTPGDVASVDQQHTNDWVGTKPPRVPIEKWAQQNVTFPQPTWYHEDIYRNRTSPSKTPSTAADINNLLAPPKTTEVMGLSPPPPERPRRPPRPQRPKPPFKFDVLTTPRAPIAIENDFPPVRSPDFNKKPIKPQDIFPPKLPENFIHHVPEYPVRTPKPRPPPRPPVTSLPINVPETQQTSDTNEISQAFDLRPDINGHSKPVTGDHSVQLVQSGQAVKPIQPVQPVQPVQQVKRPKPPKKPETILLYEKPVERPSIISPTRTESTTPSGNVIWGSETVFEPEEFNKYKTPIIKDTTRKMVTTLISTGSTTIFGDFYTPKPSETKSKPTSRKPVLAPTYTTTLTVTTTMTTVVHSVGQKPSTKTIVLTKTILSTIVDKVTETQTLVKPTTATVTQTHTIATTKTALIVPTMIRPTPTKSHTGVTLKPEIFVADPHSKDTMTISVSTSMSKEKKTEEKRKHSGKRPETDNDSILVVMTNKHPKINLSREHFDNEAENVEGAGVFLGGVYNADTTKRYKPPIWQMECVPECRATRNERCQKLDGTMKCVCRPGFARMFPDRPCMPTYTYNMKLLLDKSSAENADDLQQSESTYYVKLKALTKEGLDRMIMQSDLRDVFQGVSVNGIQPMQKKTMVDFYVQLSENTDETKLTDVFKKTLRHSNYSLGGTELYAAREADTLEAEDFNECLHPKFHDCSENARCFNLRGTYTCSCKEGFTDLSENTLFPGRMCSDMIGCEYCGYHGTCYTRDDNQITCECFQWYSGDRCRINLKVLLIALVTIGSILLALLLVCGVLTCLKRKSRSSTASRNNGSSGYLRYRGPPTQSLDKRAMIAADSSSESSVENLPYINPPPPPPPPSGTLSAKRKSVLRQNVKGPAPRPKELSVEQQDRSVTVMIPRAKYRPVPPMSPLLTMSTFSPDKHLHRTSAQISTEQKLINYLEGNSREGTEQKPSQKTYDTPRSAPAFKKEQRVFEYEYKTSNMQINDGTSSNERRSSKHGDSERRFRRHSDSTHLQSDNSRSFQHRKYSAGALVSAGFEVSATVGLRHNEFDTSEDEHSGILNTSTMKSNRSQFTTLNRTGDHKTMSEARSYDETTIHPPTRTLKTNYSGSSPSSRANNDEGHTMVERDLGSTFIMPESHLFKPERDRGSDISTFDSL